MNQINYLKEQFKKEKMKKILIYGDSNTWGDNFFLGKRIDDDKQWANILQKKT